jgi:hypothetical protein
MSEANWFQQLLLTDFLFDVPPEIFLFSFSIINMNRSSFLNEYMRTEKPE